MKKSLEELNLCNDYLFARTMQDKSICKRVLKEITGLNIDYVEEITDQKTINLDYLSKGIRLDVYVHDEKHTVYNVEIQCTNNDDLGKRSRYYQGSIDLHMIQHREKYKNLKKSYIIFICTFDPFSRGRHQYTFENICLEEPNLKLNDDTHKIFLNTKGIIDDVSDDLISFLKYLENSTDTVAEVLNSSLVREVNERVKAVKENKEMRIEYMTLLQKIEEYQDEARMAEKLKIAKAILDLADDATIASKTGLPIETISQLRKETIQKS